MSELTRKEFLKLVAAGPATKTKTHAELVAFLDECAKMEEHAAAAGVKIKRGRERRIRSGPATVGRIPSVLKTLSVGEAIVLQRSDVAGASSKAHSYGVNSGKMFRTKAIRRTGELLVKRIA